MTLCFMYSICNISEKSLLYLLYFPVENHNRKRKHTSKSTNLSLYRSRKRYHIGFTNKSPAKISELTPAKRCKTNGHDQTPKSTLPGDIISSNSHAPCKKRRKKSKRLEFGYSPSGLPDKYAKELIEIAGALCHKLYSGGILTEFMALVNVICDDRLPLDNIALLLCLERAKFASLSSTTAMDYSSDTMKFWKVVYKLLKGKAVRLLSGPKNAGLIKGDRYDPKQSKCNFAVPSLSVLRNSDINSIPKELPPGIISQALNLTTPNKDYVLAIDGKKVAQGVKESGGDIDLWGHEKPEKTANKQRLHDNLHLCEEIRNAVSEYDHSSKIVDVQVECNPMTLIQKIATASSLYKRDLRELNFQQTRLTEKLVKLAEKNPDNKVCILYYSCICLPV